MKLKVIVIAVAAALSTGAFAADEAKKDTKAGGKDSAPMAQQQQGAKNGGSASAGSSSAGSGSASAGASGKQAGQERNAEGSGGKAMSRGQAHSADMVKQVQQSLKDKGIDAGPVDGKFGPLTQKGVKQFQEQQKFQATGQLDQQTLSALGVSGSASAGAGQAAPAKDGAKASGGASAGASGQAAPAKDGAKASGSASGGASAGSSGSADAKSGNGASASGAAGAPAPKAPKDAGEQARSGSSNDGSAGSGLPAGGDPGAASSGAGTPGSAAPASKKPKPGTDGSSGSGM